MFEGCKQKYSLNKKVKSWFENHKFAVFAYLNGNVYYAFHVQPVKCLSGSKF